MGTTENAEDPPAVPPTPQTQWCVAANVVDARASGAEGRELSGGTKHFKPGAKVYAFDWGSEDQSNLVVIGHHRKSRQFLKAVVSVTSLEQFRLEEVTIPTVTALAQKHFPGGTEFSRERAELVMRAAIAQQILR